MNNKLTKFIDRLINATKNKEKSTNKTLSDLIESCLYLVNHGHNIRFIASGANNDTIEVYRNGSYIFTMSKSKSCYNLDINDLLVDGGKGYMSYTITSKDKEYKEIENLFNLCAKQDRVQEQFQQTIKHKQTVLNNAVSRIRSL